MSEILPVLVVSVAGWTLVALCAKGLSRRERKWIALSFFMHIAFACAQVPIALGFYGSSDMFLYFSYGEILSAMMERDPGRIIPEVTALLLHRDYHLPLRIIGAGSATGSMSALAAWSFYFLGPSKYASCVAFGILSLCGKVGMYRTFRANVDPSHRFWVAVAALFVPSFVFWSSGLIKEAVAIAGFGWALYGLHLWVRESKALQGALLIVLGSVPVLLMKPYILFPFVLAGGTWYYWARGTRRGRVRVRPAYLVAAGFLAVGGIVALGRYFPDYSADTFSARAFELQTIGRGVRGGSNFMLSGDIPNTLAGQLAYAPVALLASLFRPSIIEARNLLMLANAIETTVLTLLLLRLAFTRNLGRVRREVLNDPFLVFCLVFVIAFGIAVGLTSTNLGTLSRYRSPILPFFAILLFVLQRPRRAPEVTSDARRQTPRVLGPA